MTCNLAILRQFSPGRFRARKRISRFRKSGPSGLFSCLTHCFEVEETMPAPPPPGRSCQALTPPGLAVISTGKQVLPGRQANDVCRAFFGHFSAKSTQLELAVFEFFGSWPDQANLNPQQRFWRQGLTHIGCGVSLESS